jgi:hypothetical protein
MLLGEMEPERDWLEALMSICGPPGWGTRTSAPPMGAGLAEEIRSTHLVYECSNDLGIDQEPAATFRGMDEFLKSNRELWDEWTGIHESSDFYKLQEFREGGIRLRDYEVDQVGDVRGKTSLHLQCHFHRHAVVGRVLRMGHGVYRRGP